MADDLGEKTEDATPKRKAEARDQGNVARSQDLAGAMLLAGATIALWVLMQSMLGEGKLMVGAVLDGDLLGNPVDPINAWSTVLFVGAAAARIALPAFIAITLTAVLVHLWQIGWLFAPKAMQPSLDKLSPSKGFKRIFSLTSLMKACLDVAKVAVVLTVAVWTIQQYKLRILTLPYLDMMPAIIKIGWLMLDLAFRVLAVLLLLGIIDYIYQKWKHAQDLKMTKQQIKDEMKQSEGDPETKRRRLRMQQQIAMQRIGAAVPQADVIVTNPEHISIAIKYDAETMRAPKVLAKGADHLALRIRHLGMRYNIPIVERKPLARALYREVSAGQEIPPEFYKAVAEILAYVYRLSERAAG